MREIEAVSFGKMMITNNPEVHKAPFYNANNILQYKNTSEITESFAKKIKCSEGVEYKHKDMFSPKRFLDYLESKLSKDETNQNLQNRVQ